MHISFYLNSKRCTFNGDSQSSLLLILQQYYGIMPSFIKCNTSHCGYCMVLMNDIVVASCLIPAFILDGRYIETIEGIKQKESFRYLQKGFAKAMFFPCERCFESKIILAESILRKKHISLDTYTLLQYISYYSCSCSSQIAFIEGIKRADELRNKRRNIYAKRK